MWNDAMWLGLPQDEIRRKKIFFNDMTGRFAYFRHGFFLEQPGKLQVDITANTRYRLWVNERPVASGPCKGDAYRHYYETLDLSEYLLIGQNTVAVQVLYQEPHTAIKQTDSRAAIYSVYGQGGGHRLALEGSVVNDTGESVHTLTTGIAEWRVWLDHTRTLLSSQVTEYLGAVCEGIDFSIYPGGWKTSAFDDSGWLSATPLEPVKLSDFMRAVGLVQRFPIRERPIPLLDEIPAVFTSAFSPLKVPAGTSVRLLLDAGEEVNGYPQFSFQGGKNSKIEITYFEKFTGADAKSKVDAKNGQIVGVTDKLILSGENIVFEPFWYRTFRFISISVTAKADVTLLTPAYRKTSYPLKVDSWISSSEAWVEEIWSLCVRTLKNCMMETYMDCPYYEQNQFPMDTRLQALFCAAASCDDRLTRKALEDFHCSMTPDGLVQGRYPAVYPQIISTFSLYYIFMLEEFWRRTGDLETIRQYLPDVDRMLEYYQNKIGADGLVGRLGYWEFIDWQQVWSELGGIPAALEHGPSTIINLMYALALDRGAALMEAAGRAELGNEYRRRQKEVLDKVRSLCWDEGGQMFREGPAFSQYSQHAQSWAVLNGILTGEQAVRTLRRAMADPEVLRCSFSTSFEWFRALETAGIYQETQTAMLRWAALPAMGNTTCPETPDASRSECHAWSALPMYEFICVMAGIRERNGVIEIRPAPSYLPDLHGAAATKAGPLQFNYTKEGSQWRYQFVIPEGVDAVFHHGDGRAERLHGGKTCTICEV